MASSLSRKIFIGIMVMFVLSFFPPIRVLISGATVLVPSLVVPGLELWRLVTYPIAISLFGILIGSICFSVPGKEMESMLDSDSSGFLLIVTVGSALMHLALFFGSSGLALAGPANPAIFILVGFVYLFPHSEVRLFFFNVRTSVIVSVIAAVMVTFTLYMWLDGGQSPLMFFSYGGFGLLLGGSTSIRVTRESNRLPAETDSAGREDGRTDQNHDRCPAERRHAGAAGTAREHPHSYSLSEKHRRSLRRGTP